MANKKHLEILKKGVKFWNKWRKENKSFKPELASANLVGASLSGANLSGADLSGADLSEADLSKATLSGATLSDAILNGANLKMAVLSSANLSRANLSKAKLYGTDLSKAKLYEADLSRANLSGAKLSKAKLVNVDFSDCSLNGTLFSLTSLIGCKGLDSVIVKGECSIDFQTLKNSEGLPKEFLLKIGLSENYINYLPDFFHDPGINLFPVFLSHSWTNKDFAGKLYNALIKRGVQVWYDEKKMKPGDDILDSIDKGINVYDKMILVCSKESLNSWWVEEELDRIFEKERKYRNEKGKKHRLLIPITIDDALFESNESRAKSIKKRIVGDFKNWENEEKFEQSLNQLIEALNADRKDDNIASLL